MIPIEVRVEYNQLKFDVAEKVEKFPAKLQELKEYFARDIQSVRQLSLVSETFQLFDLLERRAVLSELQTDALKIIALLIDDQDLCERVTLFREKIFDFAKAEIKARTNVYRKYNRRARCGELAQNVPHLQHKSHQQLSSSSAIELSSVQKEKLICDLVVKEIGQKWTYLAQNLDIRLCDIDFIEKNYPNQEAKITAMLDMFNARNESNKFFVLCRALEASRKEVLRDKILKIWSK